MIEERREIWSLAAPRHHFHRMVLLLTQPSVSVLHVSREREEDKEMAEFLKTKFPDNKKKGMQPSDVM